MAYLIENLGVTCGPTLHMQAPGKEPAFHFTQSDGHHGIASLDVVKGWARALADGIPLDQMVSYLLILLPDSRDLIPCTITVADGEKGLEMEIEALKATTLDSGVVYTCAI